ncbi:hypothetical protein GXP67_21020 [Rhodocytophaga rosea]|uniref:DoxX family protein n=1 Tax=Rhodocytophaga rosea TaxID=2704465 RepID=A0A6C0GMX5_9BACT|nr:hypothetical protein [Rhodocytophaga rosea]QHT68952.1 hypothetical protein GXP67_21020 [Rhodocytophaga rosea]
MKNNLKIFRLLMLAYGISIAYQYYRSQVYQYPAFDTFATSEIVGYAFLFGWSSLSLIRREWALWSIVVLSSFQLGLGFSYYIPVVFSIRHDSFWDWAALMVFVFLMAFAGYLAIKQLNHIHYIKLKRSLLNLQA